MSESAFNRGDTVLLDIKAEHPENVVCTASIAIPDPNVRGTISSLQEATEDDE